MTRIIRNDVIEFRNVFKSGIHLLLHCSMDHIRRHDIRGVDSARAADDHQEQPPIAAESLVHEHSARLCCRRGASRLLAHCIHRGNQVESGQLHHRPDAYEK